jgi:thiamine biosynthesis lipoprotein
MGTTWRLYHDGGLPQAVAERVAAAVEDDEQRWSRFRPTSELSYLNRCAGIPVEASADTVELLQTCDRFTRETDGLFAPLVGRAVIAWGYEVSRDARPPGTAASPAAAPARRDLLVYDERRRIVEVPRGALLDLGGIAKTWSCARAAALVTRLSDEPSLLLEAGGDLVAARGSHVVAIEDGRGPDHPPAAHVRLHEGEAVCTSGWSRRHWTNADGVEAHHLIDPRTGAPAPRRQATVISGEPARSEVLAKVLVIDPARLDSLAEAALVADDDGVRSSAAWAAAVVAPTAP